MLGGKKELFGLDAGKQESGVELGHAVVSQLCSTHYDPFLWKFLHNSLSSSRLSPLLVLSLLTSRAVPHRHSQPEAYRLYLELLFHHALSFNSSVSDPSGTTIIESVDAALQLSHNYGVRIMEIGQAFVLFFFSIIIGLLDCTIDDYGLQMTFVDPQTEASKIRKQSTMGKDSKTDFSSERSEQIQSKNPFRAVEVLAKLTESTKAIILLRLVYLNMPQRFEGLLQRLHFLNTNITNLGNLKSQHHLLAKISSNLLKVVDFEYPFHKRKFIRLLIQNGYGGPSPHRKIGPSRSNCWVPFDVYMENAMDGRHLPIRSAVAILTETMFTLRVVNQASWQETFLELWISALRVVQREREPLDGPIPHLEVRLCMLLSIVPLAIVNVMDIKLSSSLLCESAISAVMNTGDSCRMRENDESSRRNGLVTAMQLLGNFSELLCPPASVVEAANSAEAKAAQFISTSNTKMEGLGGGISANTLLQAGGNMRHLIVEACIARNLIDTSAYFWPGYASSSVILERDAPSIQKSPWSTFMEGATLSSPLTNLLLTTPASSLAEIEKLYHIALGGSTEDRAAAAKILCGASLTRGWNIQEHVVHIVVKLLSPPPPPGHSGQASHLIDHMPMLSAVLFEASSIETVHILSLHGVIPKVAAALLPLCEVFGSLVPGSSSVLNTGDEPSVYMIFSMAFLFLLRLWKFYRPPLQQCISGGTIGFDLSLEYLLLLHNNSIASDSPHIPDGKEGDMDQLESELDKPVYIDYFPKLRAWYCQNKSCIASTLSGICTGSHAHQVADKILTMIFAKVTKSGPSSSGSIGGSPTSTGEDPNSGPALSAWEVLEAIPLILEAMLTACGYGRLSSRDLTTGLRDLVDFVPASLAVIISYFSAEVTRGIWKPVPMNGIDWPSPAAILPLVESEMKQILAAAGVTVSICSSGVSPVMLPLPVAALVSLTITFKLTKDLEYIHAVAGPALENCASGCPWPSIPTIGSLWAQKIRRWHNFIVVSCARSVFRQNKEAVSQLLGSCFTSFLGSAKSSTSLLTNDSGINCLLGSIVKVSWTPLLAPGFLYLRTCQTIHNFPYVNDVIVGLVVENARESAVRWTVREFRCLNSREASLSVAIGKAREIATLGASLLAATGGVALVQELYRETMPTLLLSPKEQKAAKGGTLGQMLEGYALAYLLVLSGSLVWGVGPKPPIYAISRTRRTRILGVHMDFLARVLEGNVSLGCDPAVWKAYVSCIVGLITSCAPAWVQEVRLETLRILADGLRGWHESELALWLLESGGVAAMGSFTEFMNRVL